VLAGTLAAIIVAAGFFFIGRATSDSGPETLAEAVNETATGDLPVGSLDLGALLGALRERGAGNGLGDLGDLGELRDLLRGSGLANGLLRDLLDQLGQQLENRPGGSGGTASGPPSSALGEALA
jgi:hypothetical protein